MTNSHKREGSITFIIRYFMLTIGAGFAAIAIDLFLVPNTIIDGGIIGISLIINYMSGFSFGILVFLINLPFLFAGYKYIGRKFFISSLYSIIMLAIFEWLFQYISILPITTQPLLATVFGGLLLGVGVGIVIRNSGALDGTEILGILLARHIPFSVGEFVMFINVFIFSWAGFVLGWEQAMFSILAYYIASRSIDAVIQGFDDTKAAMVISNEYQIIADALSDKLGRGVTKLKGTGGYLDQEKEVLYVVFTRLEVAKFKSIVLDIDANAFITIMDTQEAHGGKFSKSIHH